MSRKSATLEEIEEAEAESEGGVEFDENGWEVADSFPIGKRRGRGPGMDIEAAAERVIALSPKATVIVVCEVPQGPPENFKGDPGTFDPVEDAAKKARGRAQTLKQHFAHHGIAVVARENKVWAQYVGFLAE